MATELGQAFVQIMPSAKGISGAIRQQLDPEADAAGSSAGESLGGKFVSVLKGVIATAAIGKFFQASLMEGADLQQSLGGVETLFKGSADKVKKYADEAYKTAGLSANDYMENVTSFSASLLQSVSGDTEKAADQANMAMVDMSDNANKMGTNMGDIQNAYQGFAKQNYTMLDNLKLGYGGTKEEMQRLLTDAQKLTGVKYDINNLSDVYSAIHAVQGELGVTGTTAKEAAQTFSGSFDAMKSAASNVLGKLSLGMNIQPELNALAQTVSTFLFQNFFPMVGNILSGLPGAIMTFVSQAAPYFIQAGSQMLTQLSGGITTGMPGFIASFQTIVTGILTWVTTNLPVFLSTGVSILTNIANGILTSLPQLILTAGSLINTFVTFLMMNIPVLLESGKNLLLNLISGIITNLPAIGASAIQAVSQFIDTIVQNYPRYIATGWQILMSLINGILERLPSLISTAFSLVGQFIGMLISKLPDIISTGGEMLLSLIGGLISSIPGLIGAIGKIGGTIIGELSKIDLLAVGRDIIKGLWNGISDMAGWIQDKIAGFGKGVLNSLKSFFGIKSPSRLMRDEIGRYLAEGVGVGIDRYSDLAYAAMDTLGTGIQDRVPTLDLGFTDVGGVLDANAVIRQQVQTMTDTVQPASTGDNDKVLALLKVIADKSPIIDGASVSEGLAPHASAQQITRTQTAERGGAVVTLL